MLCKFGGHVLGMLQVPKKNCLERLKEANQRGGHRYPRERVRNSDQKRRIKEEAIGAQDKMSRNGE